jgi:hypothetical protein
LALGVVVLGAKWADLEAVAVVAVVDLGGRIISQLFRATVTQ